MRYTVDHFEGDKEDFVLDPLTDWEPVERTEYWSDVVPKKGYTFKFTFSSFIAD